MGRARLALLVLAVSCAETSRDTIPNDIMPRSVFHYTNGDTFELEHQKAMTRVFAPSRPSKIDDGTVAGRVCGADVFFDVQWFGDTVTFTGQGNIPWQSYPHDAGPMLFTLGISEVAPGRRMISGQFGKHVFSDSTSPIVDLDVSADHLEGSVDGRHDSLAARGDYLVGRMRQDDDVHQPVDAPFAIYGRDILSSIAPADEGLALTALLACDGLVEYDGRRCAASRWRNHRMCPAQGTK